MALPLRNFILFRQARRRAPVGIVPNYLRTIIRNGSTKINSNVSIDDESFWGKDRSKYFDADNSDWSVHSTETDFEGSEPLGDIPFLSIDRPCNMRSGFIVHPDAYLKEIYDKEGKVAMSEVVFEKKRDEISSTSRKIAEIRETPKPEHRVKDDDYTQFLTYLKLVIDSKYIKEKFKLVKISDEVYNNTCNVLISRLSTKKINKEMLSDVMKSFDMFLKNKNIEYEVVKMITNLMISIYPEETKILVEIKQLLWTLDVFKACGHDSGVRRIKRRVYLHVGPTNSGKTYEALKSLINARTGIYCAPLRILAHEVYEKLKKSNKSCGLVTGEERRETYKTTHWSTTIEVSPSLYNTDMDVGVIDEVQLAAHHERGHSWTSAIVNLKVKELHLCGDPSICRILHELLTKLGDDVTYKTYEMLNQIVVANLSLQRNQHDKFKPFDCIVSFNVKTLYTLKQIIESTLPYRCAIIYGSMPPSCRIRQVNLFNDPKSPFKILLATDAIGMGLNINIRRIIFYQMEKFDGNVLLHIPEPLIKQIAGRCGRYSSPFRVGEVSCFDDRDIHYLRKSIKSPYQIVTKVGISPTNKSLDALNTLFPGHSFLDLLKIYRAWVLVPNGTFLCSMINQMMYAKLISNVKMGIRDAYKFCSIPIPLTKVTLIPAFYKMLSSFVRGEKCYVSDVIKNNISSKSIHNTDILDDLQMAYKILNAYVFLSHEYPHIYHDTIGIEHYYNYIIKSFDLILMKISDIKDMNDYVFHEKKVAPLVQSFILDLKYKGKLSNDMLNDNNLTVNMDITGFTGGNVGSGAPGDGGANSSSLEPFKTEVLSTDESHSAKEVLSTCEKSSSIVKIPEVLSTGEDSHSNAKTTEIPSAGEDSSFKVKTKGVFSTGKDSSSKAKMSGVPSNDGDSSSNGETTEVLSAGGDSPSGVESTDVFTSEGFSSDTKKTEALSAGRDSPSGVETTELSASEDFSSGMKKTEALSAD